MARTVPKIEEPSDFEKQRLANIAERDALLKKLTQEANQAGLFTKPSPSAQNGQKRTSSSRTNGTPAKRVKKESTTADVTPRRTSSRLAGLQADSEVAKQKAEEEYERVKEVERAKRQRVTGDLNFAGDGLILGTDVLLKGVAKPYERTFFPDEAAAGGGSLGDKDLKDVRERLGGLQLWDQWEVNRIKITPERVYAMAFHSTDSKPIIFAGDKMGTLGIVDASQTRKSSATVNGKKENDNDDADEEVEEEEEEIDSDPQITQIKPHTRTISAILPSPSRPETIYTSSYDSSIRSTDLTKSTAVEIYGPSSREDDEPISGIDMAASDPHTLYFATLNGGFGRYDTRTSPADVALFQLSEKKIGGFSLHPGLPHFVATASLDRYLRVWDLRKMDKKAGSPVLVGEHESRLSVSHAAFNAAGQVATTSYDDTVKIHSFGVGKAGVPSMKDWSAGFEVPEQNMKPEVVVRHNNQT